MIIGSHVSMSGKDMLLGSVKEALSYGANTFMFYTGAPQNTRRKAISELKVEEAKALMKENNIDLKNVVVHAPYIINLANTVKEETFELAVNFLKQELQRCQDIGTSILVLHPGSHVKAGEEVGLQQIIKGLNEVLKDTPYQGKIALETVSYTHLRAHETDSYLVCRLLLEKKKKKRKLRGGSDRRNNN